MIWEYTNSKKKKTAFPYHPSLKGWGGWLVGERAPLLCVHLGTAPDHKKAERKHGHSVEQTEHAEDDANLLWQAKLLFRDILHLTTELRGA